MIWIRPSPRTRTGFSEVMSPTIEFVNRGGKRRNRRVSSRTPSYIPCNIVDHPHCPAIRNIMLQTTTKNAFRTMTNPTREVIYTYSKKY